MAHLSTLAALGSLAVLGATAGVHLGQSAIAEIDPVYFTQASILSASRHAQMATSAWSLPVASEASPLMFPVLVECIGCPDRVGQLAQSANLGELEDATASGAPPILPLFLNSEASPKESALVAADRPSALAMSEGYDQYPVSEPVAAVQTTSAAGAEKSLDGIQRPAQRDSRRIEVSQGALIDEIGALAAGETPEVF